MELGTQWGAPITQKGSDRSCNSYNWCNDDDYDDDNGDDNGDDNNVESDDDSVDESDVSTTSTGPGAESMEGVRPRGSGGQLQWICTSEPDKTSVSSLETRL